MNDRLRPDTDGGSRPVPDPTVLTTEALTRGLAGERDYVDGQLEVIRERLRGIDTATRLLNETVNRVPTALTEGLGHLEAVMDERFRSIDKQFAERDTRSERESRDNKVAVDAAFAAQKEAAAKQDEANSKAIDKSEAATSETITKLAELFKSTTDALAGKNDDLKERVGRIESVKQGATESRVEHRAGISNTSALVGIVVAVLAGLSLYLGTRAGTNTPTVTVPTVVTVAPAP